MSYEYAYAMEESMTAGMIIFYIIYMLAAFAMGIAAYVLRSLGTYTIAKRRGINHPWFSWIPVLDAWILGCISDQYQYVVKGKNKSKRKWLLILNIVLAVLYVVMLVCFGVMVVNTVTGVNSFASEEELAMGMMGPMMGVFGMCIPLMGVAIAVMVLRYMALYDLYTSCTPQNNVLFLVLSILFSVSEPFFIFFSRKKDGGMPPRREAPRPEIPAQPVYERPVYEQPGEPRGTDPEA